MKPNFFIETAHFSAMLRESGISRSWIESAVFQPDKIEEHADGTRHFLKKIDEFGGRWLRVVVNAASLPGKYVIAFFDRRLRRQQCASE